MDNLPEVLARINTRLDALENRVALFEHLSNADAPLPAAAPASRQVPAAASPSLSQAGAIFPVLGRAMLGMAGAYALRALAESGSFPKLAAVALAIAYAAAWLVGAVRVPARPRFAGATYAGTSALILAPMLWEITLRFKVLSPAAAAGVLATFVFAAYVLAWKKHLTAVVGVAFLTGAITALALLIATHETVPFIAVLLLMTLLSEVAVDRNRRPLIAGVDDRGPQRSLIAGVNDRGPQRSLFAGVNDRGPQRFLIAGVDDRWMSLRPVAAVAADVAVWALIYIYSSPQSSRVDYPNLSAAGLLSPAYFLLLIYGASVTLRTIVLRRQITIAEAGQAVIAFLLAMDAVFHFAPAVGVALFAVFCLALSAAAYTALFTRFSGIAERRNYSVCALWSAVLLLLGCCLCLDPLWLASCFGIAAIAATSVGVRVMRLTLVFHGLVFLLAAAFVCGWIQYAAHALAGTFPAPPLGVAWLIAALTVLCYAIGGQLPGESWKHRAIQLLSASLAVGSMATVLVSALVWMMAALITPGASHVAVARTLAACSMALALANLGPRWQRVELVWLAYATLSLVTAKLLFEDLRQGRPEFIAASIFLYAVTLILVPRLARRASRTSAPASSEIDASAERDTVAR